MMGNAATVLSPPGARLRRVSPGPGFVDLGERIVRSVTDVVSDRLGPRVRELLVHLREDVVVLTGRVSSYHLKQVATRAALDATARFADVGLSLENDIAVITQTGDGQPR